MKTSAKLAVGGGVLAAASLIGWRLFVGHRPYRVLSITPTPCQVAGNCAADARRYQLSQLGRFSSLQDAASAAGVGAAGAGHCPGATELRVVTGPQGAAGVEHTLAVVVPGASGGCMGSFTLVADAVAAATRNGLHLPPAAGQVTA